jgi:lysozyme
VLNPSPAFLAFERVQEGLVLHPYCCQAGVWTIGYGHTKGITESTPPITKEQAEAWLVEDAREAMQAALVLSPGLAIEPAPRLEAITDFIFNLGASRYRASTLRTMIQRKLWAAAAEEIKRWVWIHVPDEGLRKSAALMRRRAVTAGWLATP